MSAPVKIFACQASRDLAERIAASYGLGLGEVSYTKFSDGEFTVSFEETVRGCDVFLIQSTMPPTDNLMELILMADAAKRASARQVIAVIPYFGFARQDRKDKPRVAIGAKVVANMLMAGGIDRVMTMDLHADQIQGFFDIPVDHLFASSVFLPYVEELKLPNLIMAAPDTGGTKRANAYAKHMNVDLAICYKQRKVANQVAAMTVIGDVEGKDVLLIDDICDTAGTLTKAASLFVEQGATSVRAMCTHAVFSGPAYERIANSAITEMIVTDTLPLRDGVDTSKIKVLTVANLFGNVMQKVMSHESISSHFIIQ